MLRSMTGFGDAALSTAGVAVTAEVRTVNNRHLKVTVRGTDPYPQREAEVEKVVRRTVRRGSVLVHLGVARPARPGAYQLNAAVVAEYLQQLRDVAEPYLLPGLAAGVLGLPGVMAEAGRAGPPQDDEWPAVEAALTQALARVDATRAVEGAAMAAELMGLHADMVARLAAVREHLPRVMHDYRGRLLERVKQAVADAGVTVDESTVIREVALFADRTDVAEEVHRLTAHFEQFGAICTGKAAGGDGDGRRLEFLAQEIGREVNTLGSKAGDVELSRQVFELKAALEQVRELVQNVE